MLFGLRSKSGISTILGTLIFIGILFTCAIPFYLRVNQANTYYTQTVDEMRRFDEKRGMEDIDVYAYPLSETSDELKVYIKNRCALPVTIVAVWVNDEQYILTDATLPPSEDQTYGPPFEVTLPAETKNFYIEVLTNRGNRFASLTNPLTYTKTDQGGFWSGGVGLAINIILKSHGFFHIKVTDSANPPNTVYEGDVFRPPHSDVLKRVAVAYASTYHIYATTQSGTPVTVLPPEVILGWSGKQQDWVYVYN